MLFFIEVGMFTGEFL